MPRRAWHIRFTHSSIGRGATTRTKRTTAIALLGDGWLDIQLCLDPFWLQEFQACASDLHFQTCFKKLGNFGCEWLGWVAFFGLARVVIPRTPSHADSFLLVAEDSNRHRSRTQKRFPHATSQQQVKACGCRAYC